MIFKVLAEVESDKTKDTSMAMHGGCALVKHEVILVLRAIFLLTRNSFFTIFVYYSVLILYDVGNVSIK